MTTTIIELIIAAITGGGLWKIFDYYLQNRQQNTHDFSAIIETWAKDNERLRVREEESREKINKLESIVNDLQAKILLLESSSQDLPFSMWIKDKEGRMLALNQHYEEEFLIPIGKSIIDYIGKYDHDVWNSDFAARMSILHQYVISTRKVVMGYTEISGIRYKIILFPKYLGRTLLGVGGMAIKENDIVKDTIIK